MNETKYLVKSDRMGAFFRYELSFDELLPAEYAGSHIEYEPYYVQWSDIRKLLENLRSCNDTPVAFDEKWGSMVVTDLMEQGSLFLLNDEETGKADFTRPYGRKLPENAAEAMYTVAFSLEMSTCEVEEFQPEARCRDFIDFECLEQDISLMEEGRFSEIRPLFWTDEGKAHYLRFFDYSGLDMMVEEELALVRDAIESLMGKGYPDAMKVMAYSCYGGNRLYPCDWRASHDLLIHLLEKDDPFSNEIQKGNYANSLGYIYFYGRCNDGVPQYDKAFYYFSIGMASGCHESVYKLADMFSRGLGTEKNETIARNLIEQVYDTTRELFQAGQYSCEFADAALRMGKVCEQYGRKPEDADPDSFGSEGSVNLIHAYKYYLEAQLAIELRRKQNKFYGDESVAGRIHEAVERLRPICEDSNPQLMMQCNTFPDLFNDLLENRRTSLFTVRKTENYIEITGKRIEIPGIQDHVAETSVPPEDRAGGKKLLVVLPEYGICRLVDQVTYRVRDIREFWVAGDADSFKANIMNWVWRSDKDRYEFYRDDELVAYIGALYYVYEVDE
ncbi:MAG: hypothetical protein LIP12_13975 [Clostridiales bacterium]|nr:hypothetical protein [Clostridiales bacterium]